MRRAVLASWIFVGTALGCAVACGGSGDARTFGTDDDGGAGALGDAASMGTGDAAQGPAGDGGSFQSDTGAGTPPPGTPPSPGKVLLYAHTDTTLYSLDPSSVATPPTLIGDFDCATTNTPMTDLAVTKDGALFAVSETAVYPLVVQGSTVHCSDTWKLPSGARFYGLTIAPEGVLGASEVMVAANSAGELYQIDKTTGNTTQVGTLGTDPNSGLPWSLSGDIVFLANGGAPIGFATVRTCTSTSASSCSSVDTLVEVDVSAIHPGTQSVLKGVRGSVKKGSWCTNAASPSTFGSMYGIAAYGNEVYGFSRKGDVVAIHNDDGSGCLVAAYANEKYAGAGVSTTAPVVAPPPIQ